VGIFSGGPIATVTAGQTTGVAAVFADLVSAANADGDLIAYTPTWGSTGTAPAIGNGTIVGAWTQSLNRVHFIAGVTFGSTTTFGTGNYTLTLPIAPLSTLPYWSWIGYALNGGSTYQVTLDVNGGSTTAVLNYQSSTGAAKTRVGATAPVTWSGTGNGFWFSGTFWTA